MIAYAVAITGPNAGLWANLRSIEHTLDRALSQPGLVTLADLDKERLQALVDLLRRGMAASTASPRMELRAVSQSAETELGPAIDVKHRILSVPAFEEWRKASKLGFEAKVQKLIDATQEFINKPPSLLVSKDAPRQEFQVLLAIVRALTSDVEVAL